MNRHSIAIFKEKRIDIGYTHIQAKLPTKGFKSVCFSKCSELAY